MRYPLLAACLMMAAPAAAQDEAVTDPAQIVRDVAMSALDEMSAKLGTLDTFEVNVDALDEEVFAEGEKLQFVKAIRYKVDRPGKLYVSIRSDRRYRRIYYDGAALTVTAPTMGFYATTPMTGTIRELLAKAYDEYGIDVPLQDLFLWGQEGVDRPEITRAFLVGFAQVGDFATDQYFFRAEGVDWQIWIGRDDKLPHRLVIVNTEDPAQPEYIAELTWNLTPSFEAADFTFAPTEQYAKIDLEPDPEIASAQ